jgi:hypothetical protein
MAAIDKVYLNTVTVWFDSESDGTNTMEYDIRECERIRVTSLKIESTVSKFTEISIRIRDRDHVELSSWNDYLQS